MGTWNTGLFSNDTTLDVRETYMQFLKMQFSNEDAYNKTYEEFKELIGTEEESLFWYALADTQWNVGRLMPSVKKAALKFIFEDGGISLWEEDLKKRIKWQNTLKKLEEKLESPIPKEKIIKKPIEFETNPWNIGDIYAYRFHTDISKKHSIFEKYILFQKIGDIEYYKDTKYSTIQIFDKIFDSLPNLDSIQDIRVLPLCYPPGTENGPASKEDYIPPFEYFMKATMIYEKKVHYPKKHFIFIGNKNVTQTKYSANDFSSLFWEKDKMEEWLIEYYLNWQSVEY